MMSIDFPAYVATPKHKFPESATRCSGSVLCRSPQESETMLLISLKTAHKLVVYYCAPHVKHAWLFCGASSRGGHKAEASHLITLRHVGRWENDLHYGLLISITIHVQ